MESAETPLRKLKISYTIEVRVSTTNERELWAHFDTQPWMCINLGAIPYEVRKHLKPDDILVMTIDLEPHNAQPKGPPIE